MVTLENRFFPVRTAACFAIEGSIIFLSVIASYTLLGYYSLAGSIELHDAVIRGIVVAFFCQASMYLFDLYDLRHSHSVVEMFFVLVFAVGFVCISVGFISYVLPEFGVSGTMYYITVIFVIIFLTMWRIAFEYYLKYYAPQENVLIVGSGPIAMMVSAEIQDNERLGFNFMGYVVPKINSNESIGCIGEKNIACSYDCLAEFCKINNIKRIVVAIEDRRGYYPTKELLAVRVSGCNVLEWHRFYEMLSGRILIDYLSPSFFILSEGFRKSKVILCLRRIISAVFAAFALILLAPLLLVVAIFIKLDSNGPILYSQTRVGQNGEHFRILKFRSMRPNAESKGTPQWAAKNDTRITRIGKYLRLARIDELPQLVNVLRGDLDIVGPRPERPEFVEKLQQMFPYYTLRHSIKPGITGWAQVMFTYCGTIEESKEKLQYDLFYIKNMSLNLDLLILFRTLKIVILGRGAR